jgi:hypothetical protein
VKKRLLLLKYTLNINEYKGSAIFVYTNDFSKNNNSNCATLDRAEQLYG